MRKLHGLLVGFAILILALSISQESFATHISQPILEIKEGTRYYLGEEIKITGWVEYDGRATSDVLLNAKVSDPLNKTILDDFLTSDSEGNFELTFRASQNATSGLYTINIISMCWEQHREICTHKSAQAKINLILKQSTQFPQWIKTVTEFWINNEINDATFYQVIGYLAENKIIIIPNTQTNENPSSVIPSWIKTNAEFWIRGEISDDDFALGLEWLVNNKIIQY